MLSLKGIIQAKPEVGERVWDSWVWDPKLPDLQKYANDKNK